MERPDAQMNDAGPERVTIIGRPANRFRQASQGAETEPGG
jgi:hypothetical protein